MTMVGIGMSLTCSSVVRTVTESPFAGVVALIAAAFGGLAIAGERADRTGDFLAMLPVSRLQIPLSKWLISLATLGVCLTLPLLVAFWFFRHGTPEHAHTTAMFSSGGLRCMRHSHWVFSAWPGRSAL
jgi:ABC-type transport system involved in multi-copper enzyme maturation permease subunit